MKIMARSFCSCCNHNSIWLCECSVLSSDFPYQRGIGHTAQAHALILLCRLLLNLQRWHLYAVIIFALNHCVLIDIRFESSVLANSSMQWVTLKAQTDSIIYSVLKCRANCNSKFKYKYNKHLYFSLQS